MLVRYSALFFMAASCLLLNGAAAKKTAREIKTVAEFNELLTKTQPTVILFYAPWCGACQKMKEPFDFIANEFQHDATIVKINADNERLKTVVDMFNIEAIPTMVIKTTGVIPKEKLSQTLTSLLGKPKPKKEAPVKALNKTLPKKAKATKKK